MTGPSFASVNDDSVAEYDVTSSAVSGGTVIDSGYITAGTGAGNRPIPGTDNMEISIPKQALTLNIDGTVADTLTIAATAITGSADVFASLKWSEIH